MFVDRIRILARGGHGGRGGLSFFRARHNPLGGPDGGNGGNGGNVTLVVNPHLNNLIHLKYAPHQYAENGRPGQNKQRTGRSGRHKIIEVPRGTLVCRLPPPSSESSQPGHLQPLPPPHVLPEEIIVDLTEADQKYVLCSGGQGGLGNMAFKSATQQAPRRFQPGLSGEEGQFELVLKSIADVGLIGYPNAGKSTLLSKLSHAKPRIASYPFTTLTPQIGILEDFDHHRQITMADIPGLIEGAHQGVGLGYEFLRHVERCSFLLFVLDAAGMDGRHPLKDYQQLRKEIRLYQKELADRPFFVVANKMDQPAAQENLAALQEAISQKIIPISAQNQDGLDLLRAKIQEALV